MLILCTKSVHFSMNGNIYLQIDEVAMGSPLGSVLAGYIKAYKYIKFINIFIK